MPVPIKARASTIRYVVHVGPLLDRARVNNWDERKQLQDSSHSSFPTRTIVKRHLCSNNHRGDHWFRIEGEIESRREKEKKEISRRIWKRERCVPRSMNGKNRFRRGWEKFRGNYEGWYRGSVGIDRRIRSDRVIFQRWTRIPSSLMEAFNVRVNIYRKCILIPWPSLNTPVINHNVLCIYTHGTDAQGPMRPAFH